jgi:hypothetical protein
VTWSGRGQNSEPTQAPHTEDSRRTILRALNKLELNMESVFLYQLSGVVLRETVLRLGPHYCGSDLPTYLSGHYRLTSWSATPPPINGPSFIMNHVDTPIAAPGRLNDIGPFF